VALDVHHVAPAQVRGRLGHGGRLGSSQVTAPGDEGFGIVDGVLTVDRGQRVPPHAVQLKILVGHAPC
jgi:hypothetical protein